MGKWECFLVFLTVALSMCLNVLLTNPIWVVVTRMQTHTKTLKTTKDGGPLDPITELSLTTADDIIVPRWTKVHYYGTGHAMQVLYGESGFFGFW